MCILSVTCKLVYWPFFNGENLYHALMTLSADQTMKTYKAIPKISGNKKTTKFWHLSLEVATFNVHGFNFWFLITSNVCKDFLKTLVMIRMILKCQKNSLFSYYLETNWRFYSKNKSWKLSFFSFKVFKLLLQKHLLNLWLWRVNIFILFWRTKHEKTFLVLKGLFSNLFCGMFLHSHRQQQKYFINSFILKLIYKKCYTTALKSESLKYFVLTMLKENNCHQKPKSLLPSSQIKVHHASSY
jgi:hypothetical protein